MEVTYDVSQHSYVSVFKMRVFQKKNRKHKEKERRTSFRNVLLKGSRFDSTKTPGIYRTVCLVKCAA